MVNNNPNFFKENDFYYDSLIKRSLKLKPNEINNHLHS